MTHRVKNPFVIVEAYTSQTWTRSEQKVYVWWRERLYQGFPWKIQSLCSSLVLGWNESWDYFQRKRRASEKVFLEKVLFEQDLEELMPLWALGVKRLWQPEGFVLLTARKAELNFSDQKVLLQLCQGHCLVGVWWDQSRYWRWKKKIYNELWAPWLDSKTFHS